MRSRADGSSARVLLRLLPWLARQRAMVALALIAFLGARLLEASVPLFLREAIDRIEASTGAGTGALDLTLPVLGIVACVVARLFVVSAARIAIRRAGIGVAFDLRQALYDRLQHQGAAFYARHSVGDMMTRAVSDVGMIRRLISMGTILLVVMIYATIVGFAAMFWLAPELAWLVAPPLPLVAWYAARASRRMNESSTLVQSRLSKVTDRTQEAFGGIRTLQAMAREEGERDRFARDNQAYATAFRRQARINSAMSAWMPSLAALATLIVLGWGGHLVLTGEISTGTFVAFFAYVGMVVQPMRVAGFLVNVLQRAAVSTGRVFEILDAPDEIADRPSGRTPELADGDLRLEGVTFTYQGAARPALEDLDLHVAPGETLAVMGRIGAGKSTLLALFARLLEPGTGRVLLDGHPVADWPLRALRERVALVPQDAFLFGQPLQTNLSYDDPERDPEAILDAARLADLAGTIDALPRGLATLVGERGVTLSGGQRQRTTIARGVIRDAPVLLLDDCFAAVDTDTEERILANLIERRGRRTTVLVTHRVSTARHADRILVLADGRIAELGDHETLMRGDGAYAALAREQAEPSPPAAASQAETDA
ncbi:MAG TPA: ABC transporter ATP-binding protein [Pseudomonadales bacterium]|nr:ABC transporter ATP-binding protein [Pseudomonadales bacterium]